MCIDLLRGREGNIITEIGTGSMVGSARTCNRAQAGNAYNEQTRQPPPQITQMRSTAIYHTRPRIKQQHPPPAPQPGRSLTAKKKEKEKKTAVMPIL